MAVHLIWTEVAQEDLQEVVGHILNDNPSAATPFSLLLVERIELLADFPELGRVLPERNDPRVREIIFRSYRIVYRLSPARDMIEIIRIWHAARGEPEFEN